METIRRPSLRFLIHELFPLNANLSLHVLLSSRKCLFEDSENMISEIPI